MRPEALPEVSMIRNFDRTREFAISGDAAMLCIRVAFQLGIHRETMTTLERLMGLSYHHLVCFILDIRNHKRTLLEWPKETSEKMIDIKLSLIY